MKPISEVNIEIAKSTELATVEEKPLSQLAKALQSPKVVDQPKATNIILALITKAEMELNHKPMDAAQRATNAKLVLEEIQTSFKTLTVEELPMIFHNGCRGEYGDFFGLSVVTFHKWLKAHTESEKRRTAVIELRKSEPVVIKQPTKAEALKMFLEMWLKRYLEYKKSGVIYFDTPFRDYKILFENDLIFHDKSEVDLFIEQSKFEFVKDFEQKRKGYALTNKVIYLDKKSIVERIEKEDETVDDEPQINGLACELAIKDYFNKSTDFEYKIKRLIDGNR